MIHRLLILSIFLLASKELSAWGQKGHDVVAYIAECHLTPEAVSRVEEVLGGHSPVYYSNWMDVGSRTPDFRYSQTWHYLNIEDGMTYELTSKNPEGDVVSAIELLLDKLHGGKLSADEEAVSLKMLIHLLGDVHCPMHVGHLSDLGGNLVEVTTFGKPTNLHSAWDTDIVEAAHCWSYTEWQKQIDRLPNGQIVALQSGEPSDWVKETFEVCRGIYNDTPAGTDISYEYIDRYTPVVERQLLKGGYRLARLLNEIYG